MRQVLINGFQFFVESGYVQVWIDGACFNNGQANPAAGWGIFWDYQHPLNACGPVFGPATNIRGEITAAIRAIEAASSSGVRSLCLNTDSQFLIDVVERYLTDWQQNGWLLTNGQPVKNKDLFKELVHVSYGSGMRIDYQFVPSHNNQFGNDEADSLAKDGARQYNGF